MKNEAFAMKMREKNSKVNQDININRQVERKMKK